MVRRRVASEKRSMAVGLRQCIRPLVESVTPGHDGYPLAFVLINLTAWKRPFPISGFESVGETHVWSAAELQAKNEQWQLVCANVFGLKWSRRLRAMMDIRSPSSVQCGRSGNDLFRYRVSKAWERPIAISIFRQQTWQELFPLNRDFKLSPQKRGRDSVRSYIRPPKPCEPACWPKPRRQYSGGRAPTVALPNGSDQE